MPDIKCGMMGFLNVRIAEAQYASQTKEKLKSPISKDVEAELFPALKKWLETNKSMTKLLIKRAMDLRKAKDEVSKIMKAASSVKNSGVKGAMLPGILATADPKTPAGERELFLVEGESAGGPAKAARDRMFQEVMCLSGKPLNALRHSMSKVLGSKPVQNMLVSLGVDPTQFKKGIPENPKFRVGRVVLLADGDNDGAHISNLILSVFYKLLPSMFDLNMVYVVDAPLFSAANKKGEKVFGYTLKEVQSKANKGSIVTRLKGWGECERDDLADIAFDLSKRKLFLVKPVDKKEGIAFVKVVGDDVTMRKQILGITAAKE
jgi:DNA gyrase/topoisomerase IV subunit B